jgi:hypothetical protein
VSSAIASIEPRTSLQAVPPTSGTIIGGWGAMPLKTMALSNPGELTKSCPSSSNKTNLEMLVDIGSPKTLKHL